MRTPDKTCVDVVIVGAGLAGCTLAWTLHWQGHSICLLDQEHSVSASSVAAGLITPITGKRLVLTDQFADFWSVALEFYQRLERETGEKLLQQMPIVRLFQSEHEKQWFLEHRSRDYSQLIQLEHDAHGNTVGFRMVSGGRLQIQKLLQVTRTRFQTLGQYRAAEIDPDSDFQFHESRAEIPSLGLKCASIVLCQGYQPRQHKWFLNIPDSPVRGDILKVRIPDMPESRILHQGVWLAPDGHQTFLLGSTYDWKNLTCSPSAAGRAELLERVSAVTRQPVEVLAHFAAVRPGMRNCKPVIAQHPLQNRLAVFNGLGTKGALWAPACARQLASMLTDAHRAVSNISWEKRQLPLTTFAHEWLRSIIQPGDLVIDATAGNGHDTVFLALLTGFSGQVIAFDIQRSAILKTAKRLAEAGLNSARLQLLHCSHTAMNQVVPPDSAAAIMFNLGYLPGGDHGITTTAGQTLVALQHAMRILRPSGVLSVIAYRGHDEGALETKAILDWSGKLNKKTYTVHVKIADPKNPISPILILIQKFG